MLRCPGRSQDGVRQYAGDTHGRVQPGAPRESARHEPHRSHLLPTTLESVVGLRPTHGPGTHGPRRATLPTPGKSGESVMEPPSW